MTNFTFKKFTMLHYVPCYTLPSDMTASEEKEWD